MLLYVLAVTGIHVVYHEERQRRTRKEPMGSRRR
jgi:hypothetical protein